MSLEHEFIRLLGRVLLWLTLPILMGVVCHRFEPYLSLFTKCSLGFAVGYAIAAFDGFLRKTS